MGIDSWSFSRYRPDVYRSLFAGFAEMSEQLAATTTITQLTLTASLIGLGVGQLLFGPLSDKIGRKRPLILSLLLFIVSSILCATTNNIYWLVVWRFIQGIAGAGGSVLSRSIARDKYQGVTLTQFFALLMTVNGLAPVLSPVLGGYIVSTFDWRTLFWVMAEISTVLLLGCLLFINETLPENKKGLIIAINRTKRGAEPPFYALLPDSKFYAGWFVCIYRLFVVRVAEGIWL